MALFQNIIFRSNDYTIMMSRPRLVFIVLALMMFSLLLSLFKGSTSIPLYQLLFGNQEQFNTIVLKLRLPRTLTAFTSGGLLALAGALMQVLLQNPLADPYVLGVSGGAALCTLILIDFGVSEYALMGGAWLGSLSAMVLMMLLARKHHFNPHTLLLSGIALSLGFSACVSVLLLTSTDSSLHSMLFWLAGDLNALKTPWLALCILAVGGMIAFLLAPGLNILSRGEQEAQALGLASKRYRVALYLLSSLFTATAVTLGGCIGFIGLIIPHLTRHLSGCDHRLLLPLSMLLGGSLLTLADTCARTLFAPQQIPVGIVMAIIGVPIFVLLLQR